MFTLSELKSVMLLSILICVLLGAPSAQAKVVDTFDECKHQFYKGTEPAGMSQNTKKICQYYGTYRDPRFASLYSEHHRIPLYSAYIFNPGCSNKRDFHSAFLIEPQLSGYGQKEMSPEHEFNISIIKENQAINEYYSYTGYDRGHLNPNSFQCGDSRDATFTLTNAAPMDACFNRVQWYQWEKEVKKMLTSLLKQNPAATPFLVTGTVPQDNYRIPRREDGESGEAREYEKVTVPSHIWTALCFAHPTDEEKSFSLAYMGQNQPESFIKVMSVPELNDMLQTLYHSYIPISIFVDDCFSTKKKSQEMIHSLYEKVQLPSSQRLQMAPDILNTFETAVRFSTDSQQPGPSPKRAKVSQMTITESFDRISEFVEQAEKMKYVAETACLLTSVKWVRNRQERSDDAYIIEDSVQCQMVPEKSMIEGWSEKYCTSPCLYNKKSNSYKCYFGWNQVRCSPLYSAITVYGEKCKANHPCGTYGYNFYWCYKKSGSWNFCSPPLWNSKAINGHYCRANHACAKYGHDFNWCYTNYSNKKQKCCTRDDCYSAVNGKTCRSDHPCGYHKYSYMWCYTVQGSWDYCCKNCDNN